MVKHCHMVICVHSCQQGNAYFLLALYIAAMQLLNFCSRYRMQRYISLERFLQIWQLRSGMKYIDALKEAPSSGA